MLMPHEFFQRNPGLGNISETVAFQPEIGSVGCPTYNGLLKFMDESEIRGFPLRNANISRSDTWDFHKFSKWTTGKDSDVYDHVYTYFPPSQSVSAKQWVNAAQLALHKQYQSLFDGFVSHMFEYTTGVVFWKTQSPWPSFRGFLYDWYLESTGALRGVQSSLGNPVSVIFDQDLHQLRLVNRQIDPLAPNQGTGKLGAGYRWVDLNGNTVAKGEVERSGTSDTNSVQPMQTVLLGTAPLGWPSNCTEVCFLQVWSISNVKAHATWYWLTDWRRQALPVYQSLSSQLRRPTRVRLGVRNIKTDGEYLRIDVTILATGGLLFYPSFEVWCGTRQLLPLFDHQGTSIVILPGVTSERSLECKTNESCSSKAVTIVLNSWNSPAIRESAVVGRGGDADQIRP